MARQQQFLGSLVNKVQSNGVLLNPGRLYPLLDAATSSVTTDPQLASLRGLYELVRGVRDIPTEQIRFLTVPRRPYVANPNRDQLLEPDAALLFQQLRGDMPVTVTPPKPSPSAPAPSDPAGPAVPRETPTASTPTPTPVPTFTGTTADSADCR